MSNRIKRSAIFALLSALVFMLSAPLAAHASPSASHDIAPSRSAAAVPADDESYELRPVYLPEEMAEAFAAASPDVSRRPVQIFDVAAGKVVQTFDNSADYQKIAKDWLNTAEGLSPSLSINDKCGYVFRIPLEQPYQLQKGSLSFQVEDVFLFYCKDRDPELLVFDAQKRPYLLTVKPDLTPFFAKTGLQP